MISKSDRFLQIKADFIDAPIWLIKLTGREAYSYEGEFQLTLLVSSTDCDIESWIKKEICFSIHPKNQPTRYFNGVITKASNKNSLGSYRFYQITVSSKLHLLAYNNHSRSFVNQSVTGIVSKLLQNTNSEKIIKTYLPTPYTVQYDESDLAFVTRLLTDSSIFYWVDFSAHNQTVYLGDSIQSYCLQKKSLHSLEQPVITITDENKFADVISDNVQVSLGQLIQLANTKLKVAPVSIRHKAQDYGGLPISIDSKSEDVAFYKNKIRCILQPEYPYVSPQGYNKPKINGIFKAQVVGVAGQEIYTNKLGQVKVWFDWDENNPEKSQEKCPWVGLRYNLAGNGFGHQFIPHIGETVLIMYQDDDAEQPVVIGSAYDQSNPPPFDLINDFASGGIKTKAGHVFYIDDKEDHECVVLNSIRDLELFINNNYLRDIKGCEHIEICGDALEGVLNGNYLLEAAKSIRLQAGSNIIKITAEKIDINAAKIMFKTSESTSADQFAHVGMQHSCPMHGGGPILEGALDVKINNKPVSCKGDIAKCGNSIDKLIQGHPNLHIDGKPVAFVNASTQHGGCVLQD